MPQQQPPTSPRRFPRTWLLLATLAVLALAVNRCLSPPAGPADTRAASLMLAEDELRAAGDFGELRAVAPPIDLQQAERIAMGASMGRFERPNSRELRSWVDARSGEEITQAVLLYDDPEQARVLESAAVPLLRSVLGMRDDPLVLEGVAEARRWTAAGYQAASFRMDGALVLVGSSRAADEAQLRRLAEAARDRVAAGLAALPTPEIADPD